MADEYASRPSERTTDDFHPPSNVEIGVMFSVNTICKSIAQRLDVVSDKCSRWPLKVTNRETPGSWSTRNRCETGTRTKT